MIRSNRIIKTAVIGFGLSGRVFHSPFLHSHTGFQLTKVVERNHHHSKAIYPYVEVVVDYNAAINDKNIDLIVICTPNIYHFQLAKEALHAGKHVVVEKPMTTTVAEADELIEIAKKKKLKLFVYHNRRWDGDFLAIEQLIKNNTLGNITYYKSHFDRYVPDIPITRNWKNTSLPASGILYDLGSHLIHQTLTLFGFPESVQANIQTKRKSSNVHDYFELTLKYPNLTAVLKSDMLVPDHKLRYKIVGDKGSYTQYGIDPQEAALNKGIMPKEKDWCPIDKSNYGNLDIHRVENPKQLATAPGNYMQFYNNVYDVIIEHKAMIIKPIEGLDVLRICEAALESNEQHKTIKVNKFYKKQYHERKRIN